MCSGSMYSSSSTSPVIAAPATSIGPTTGSPSWPQKAPPPPQPVRCDRYAYGWLSLGSVPVKQSMQILAQPPPLRSASADESAVRTASATCPYGVEVLMLQAAGS